MRLLSSHNHDVTLRRWFGFLAPLPVAINKTPIFMASHMRKKLVTTIRHLQFKESKDWQKVKLKPSYCIIVADNHMFCCQ